MQWLPTVLSTAVALVAVIAARFAVASSLSLARGLTRLSALDDLIDVLDQQHRKLAGRFYVSLRRDRVPNLHEEWQPLPGNGGDLGRGLDTRPPNGPVCENWSLAQLEGPKSAAARCECEYCESMRRARRAVKAALVPRGAEAVAKFTEENQ